MLLEHYKNLGSKRKLQMIFSSIFTLELENQSKEEDS